MAPVASESASELAAQEIEELVKVLSQIVVYWQLEFFGMPFQEVLTASATCSVISACSSEAAYFYKTAGYDSYVAMT